MSALQGTNGGTFATEMPADEYFRRAAALPDDLAPVAGAANPDAAILVTGASGFLGGYLVRTLLEQTTAPIICLMRGDDTLARRRLSVRLERIECSLPAERVSIISGSITEPQFGMSADAFQRLADTVGTVFHLAAMLNFRNSFDFLRPANVDSLVHILSLAAVGLPKRLIYTSSLSVLDTNGNHRQTVTETTPLNEPASLPLGYAQTKWTAETMLIAARARGFDVLRLRPSWIVGYNPSGEKADFITSVVRIFAAIGATPDGPGGLNLVPVSFVAEACALLGLMQTSAPPEICHLGAPRAISFAQFADAIATTGRPMDRMPTAAFLARVADELRRQRSADVVNFRHIFIGSLSRAAIAIPYVAADAPVFDSTATLNLLQTAGLPPPSLDLTGFVQDCLTVPGGP